MADHLLSLCPITLNRLCRKHKSLGLSSWLYWNQLLIPIIILPVSTSVKEMINYWLQLLHFTADLYVKSHPHFRLMVWYINAESYLWASSREMLQNPKWGASLRTASLKEASHGLCSDTCVYKSWWSWFCLWTEKQMTPSWGTKANLWTNSSLRPSPLCFFQHRHPWTIKRNISSLLHLWCLKHPPNTNFISLP